MNRWSDLQISQSSHVHADHIRECYAEIDRWMAIAILDADGKPDVATQSLRDELEERGSQHFKNVQVLMEACKKSREEGAWLAHKALCTDVSTPNGTDQTRRIVAEALEAKNE